jgi:hypothetical protein
MVSLSSADELRSVMLLIEWMVVLVSVILSRARVEVGTQGLTCVIINNFFIFITSLGHQRISHV